jgi:hypothetical protein
MVEGGIDAVQAQEPGLEVAGRGRDVPAAAGHREHSYGQAIDGVLGLALLRERVEELREIRHGQRGIQVAPGGGKGRPHQLALAEAEQVRALAAVERHPDLAQGLQGGPVPRLSAPSALRHCPHLPPIARQEDDDLAGLAELVGAQDQRFGGDEGHRGHRSLPHAGGAKPVVA